MTRSAADLPPDLPDGDVEDALREALAEGADLPPTPDAWARTTRAVARSQARRRAGALAVVAAAAAVVVLVVATPQTRHEAEPARPRVMSGDISTWPTRGNLAGRADLRAAIVATVQSGGGPRVLSVPFLGTIDDVTAAVVVGVPNDGTGSGSGGRQQLVLLHGRQSLPVERWSAQSSIVEPSDRRVLTAVFYDGGEWSRGVALTASSDVRVAWSPRPFLDASGGVRRSYVPLALEHGVGTWRTRWKAGLVTVRAEWAGRRAVVRPDVEAVAEDLAPVRGQGRFDLAPSCQDGRFAELARYAVQGTYRETGVRSSSVTAIRQIWCGRIGAERATLVGVVTSDGTDVQVLAEEVEFNGRWERTTHQWPVPPGRGGDFPMVRELRAEWDGGGRGGDRVTVTAVAPGHDLAELRDAAGSLAGLRVVQTSGLVRFELDPVATRRWRSGRADLVLLDVHGSERGRVHAPAGDPWGLQLDGPDAATDALPGG
jgi:hypothetical protein